jgi:hypothetical protein
MSELRKIWAIPCLLATLTLVGLLSALLGTGGWHVLAWIALSMPIFVVTAIVANPRRRTREAARRLDRQERL